VYRYSSDCHETAVQQCILRSTELSGFAEKLTSNSPDGGNGAPCAEDDRAPTGSAIAANCAPGLTIVWFHCIPHGHKPDRLWESDRIYSFRAAEVRPTMTFKLERQPAGKMLTRSIRQKDANGMWST
jgi:hypothetical protein